MSRIDRIDADDLSGSSDAALIGRIADARDPAAFAALFIRYASRVRASLIRSGARPGEAEDVAQETMISVWRHAARYDAQRVSAAGWIFTIARNRRIDLIRRARRPTPDPHDPHYRPDPPPRPDAEVEVAQRDHRLREAVAGLSDAQRDMVRLAFFEGLTHSEIAARTGTPLGTIKSRLRLATNRLRGILGNDFVEELLND